MERWRKQHGRRLDYEERKRKKEAREGHKASKDAQNLRGLRAKLHAESRRKEKIQMRKQIKAHEERNVKTNNEKEPSEPMPAYLLDRNNPDTAKAISSQIKNKRAEKAARVRRPQKRFMLVLHANNTLVCRSRELEPTKLSVRSRTKKSP